MEFRENLEINFSQTPGSHISRVLSLATENHVKNSILELIVDLQTLEDPTGPDNSENHPSNDQAFQTSVQIDRQLLI